MGYKLLFICFLAFVASLPCQAQTPEKRFTFNRLDAVYFGSFAADVTTTELALGNPRNFERNPLLGRSRATRIGLNAGFTTGAWFALKQLERDKPRLARWLKVGLIGLRVYAGISNAQRVR